MLISRDVECNYCLFILLNLFIKANSFDLVGASFVYTVGMRVLMFALVLISLCGLRAWAQGVDPDIREKVLAARIEAISVIQHYSQNPSYDRKTREVATRMADLLEKAGIVPAVGMIKQTCKNNPRIIANTDWITQGVALCDRGLSASTNELIQIFIHEAYHLYEGKFYMPQYYPDIYKKILANPLYEVGPRITDESETRAATIELKIMLKTYGCVFLDTGYFKSLLGKRKSIDYFMCK